MNNSRTSRLVAMRPGPNSVEVQRTEADTSVPGLSLLVKPTYIGIYDIDDILAGEDVGQIVRIIFTDPSVAEVSVVGEVIRHDLVEVREHCIKSRSVRCSEPTPIGSSARTGYC